MSSPILIVRLSALGDVIHTLPAVEGLRSACPERPLVWIVERALADLVRTAAPVDEVIAVSLKRWRRRWSAASTRHETRAALGELRRLGRGATAIDFQGLAKSGVLARLSGATDRVTFGRKAVREAAAAWLATRTVDVDPSLHVVEQNRQLAIRGLGAGSDGDFGGLQSFPADPHGTVAASRPQERIVINPGAGRPEKIWATDRFAELGRQLTAAGYGTPLVTWGPGERDLALEIVSAGGGELAPATDLRELAALLGSARLVIAGDTGPLHLAAGLGTPVVALFGPTNPARNGPWGQLEHCVSSWKTSRTMEAIEVSAVMSLVRQII